MNKIAFYAVLVVMTMTSVSVHAQISADATFSATLNNQGGSMEGHTPRGFAGSGTGLFVGDNLNPGFPNGDGVQIFLTFDLTGVPNGSVTSAILSSRVSEVQGTAFDNLGVLTAYEIRYENFSRALWNIQIDDEAAQCVFADSLGGQPQCDMSDAVERAFDDGYKYVQFLLRFDVAGDGDGAPDLVFFYNTNSNTNEAGIFKLAVSVVPDEESAEIITDPVTSKEAAPGDNALEGDNDNIFILVIAVAVVIGVAVAMSFLKRKGKTKA